MRLQLGCVIYSWVRETFQKPTDNDPLRHGSSTHPFDGTSQAFRKLISTSKSDTRRPFCRQIEPANQGFWSGVQNRFPNSNPSIVRERQWRRDLNIFGWLALGHAAA